MLNDVMRKALPGAVALLVAACQAAGPPTPGGLRPQPAELLAPARVPVLEPGSSFVFRRGDGEEIDRLAGRSGRRRRCHLGG